MLVKIEALIDILCWPDAASTRSHTVFLRIPRHGLVKLAEVHKVHQNWEVRPTPSEDLSLQNRPFALDTMRSDSLEKLRREIILNVGERVLLYGSVIQYDHFDWKEQGGERP